MEVLLFIGGIWFVWWLLSKGGRSASSGSGRGGRGQEGKRRSSPSASDEAWRQARELHEQSLPERRSRVLSALRGGQLNQKQVANVLEASTQFQFSPAELIELQAAQKQRNLGQAAGSARNCRVCGSPSLPGEDLCYSHQAK